MRVMEILGIYTLLAPGFEPVTFQCASFSLLPHLQYKLFVLHIRAFQVVTTLEYLAAAAIASILVASKQNHPVNSFANSSLLPGPPICQFNHYI